MTEIIKKCEKKMFDKILSGEKRFEVRLGDMNVNSGDVLLLKETINDSETGRVIKKKVGFSLKTKELNYWPDKEVNKFGFIIMQLED
jgi:hypothetical protein